ncbi:MAG: hypothetical protein ACTSPK_14270 [Candidatus Heimdallarchaeota archaeon]
MNKNKVENEDIVYNEWVPLHKVIIILFSLVIVMLVSIAITTSILEPQSMAIMLPFCIVLSILFILLAINFRGIRIIITKVTIEVSYGILNKRIFTFDDLVSCEATEATFKNYLGIGVRVGFDSSVAFTTHFGEAVKLTNKEERAFVFSSKHSQEICDILDKNIEKNEKKDTL